LPTTIRSEFLRNFILRWIIGASSAMTPGAGRSHPSASRSRLPRERAPPRRSLPRLRAVAPGEKVASNERHDPRGVVHLTVGPSRPGRTQGGARSEGPTNSKSSCEGLTSSTASRETVPSTVGTSRPARTHVGRSSSEGPRTPSPHAKDRRAQRVATGNHS